MGFFDRTQKNGEMNGKSEKKGLALNELNEDELLNVAGGQDYHSEQEKMANINTIKSIVNAIKRATDR